jgi:hypothetical protein
MTCCFHAEECAGRKRELIEPHKGDKRYIPAREGPDQGKRMMSAVRWRQIAAESEDDGEGRPKGQRRPKAREEEKKGSQRLVGELHRTHQESGGRCLPPQRGLKNAFAAGLRRSGAGYEKERSTVTILNFSWAPSEIGILTDTLLFEEVPTSHATRR